MAHLPPPFCTRLFLPAGFRSSTIPTLFRRQIFPRVGRKAPIELPTEINFRVTHPRRIHRGKPPLLRPSSLLKSARASKSSVNYSSICYVPSFNTRRQTCRRLPTFIIVRDKKRCIKVITDLTNTHAKNFPWRRRPSTTWRFAPHLVMFFTCNSHFRNHRSQKSGSERWFIYSRRKNSNRTIINSISTAAGLIDVSKGYSPPPMRIDPKWRQFFRVRPPVSTFPRPP